MKGKNEHQLEAIRDQGEKQLNAIEKQNENKFKITIEKDGKIVYLRKGLDQFLKIHPKSFSDRSKILLKRPATDENRINYEYFS